MGTACLLITVFITALQAGPAPRTERDNHSLQLGVAYEPGPGPRIFGRYVYPLFPSGFTTADFGWAGQLFGAISYTHQVKLDFQGYRRAAVTPVIFTEYQPNRLFESGETDERRTGGGLGIGLEFRLPGQWQYDHNLQIHHMRVMLFRDEGPFASTNVTNFETGPRFLRTSFTGLVPNDILMEARVLGGWVHDDAGLFGRIRLGGRWHHPFGAGFAVNAEVHGEWVSPAASVFELASFGGNLNVRGYRAEEHFGRALWTAQQELWIPVPGTTDATGGLGAILRHSLRLAVFLDAGGVGSTGPATDPGLRTGAGAGLRLRLGGVTLRADWGHRLTDLELGKYKGDFFVTLSPDMTLFLF